MFTGLISDVGKLERSESGCYWIACNYPSQTIEIGASIACDGCCLTVISVEAGTDGKCLFSADVSEETLRCTKLGSWRQGVEINLERPLTLGSELGGHVVTGHVDGVAEILSRNEVGTSVCFRLKSPPELSRFIAPKGSVALDGTSLTINDVSGDEFEINIIPHTLKCTNWGVKMIGDRVNLEVDLLARYVARLHEAGDET